MLSPQEAAKRLMDQQTMGMNDPTERAHRGRWWWGPAGVLCFGWWQEDPTKFQITTHPEYVWPLTSDQ
jgi:hypothetical protein